MKQITLNIPDSELDFFLKLIQKFKYKTSKPIDFTVSDGIKQLVANRRKAAKADDYITHKQHTEKSQKKILSVKELNERVSKSEEDFKNKRFKTTSELLAKY